LRHGLVRRYGRLAGVTGYPADSAVLLAGGKQKYCRQTQSRGPYLLRDPFHGVLLKFSVCEKTFWTGKFFDFVPHAQKAELCEYR
jgi:hypothetical protein